MKRLKLFENFQDKPKFYYRKTRQGWLLNLLKDGEIMSNPTQPDDKFISLTTAKELEFDFGPYLIKFDAKLLDKQGARVVEYTEEFFEKNPDISKHITDCYTKEDFYKDPNSANGAGITDETTWDEVIEMWSEEEEVVIEKIKMVPGLIIEVECEDHKIKDELRDLLHKNKIKLRMI
jgi:hypothetical protein